MISTAISPAIGGAMATQTTRSNEQRQVTLTVYHKAIEAVTSKAQWANGETVVLYEGVLFGRPSQIWIANNAGRLSLTVFREGETLNTRFYSEPFLLGLFVPDEGWCVSTKATEQAYIRWNRQTSRAIGGAS